MISQVVNYSCFVKKSMLNFIHWLWLDPILLNCNSYVPVIGQITYTKSTKAQRFFSSHNLHGVDLFHGRGCFRMLFLFGEFLVSTFTSFFVSSSFTLWLRTGTVEVLECSSSVCSVLLVPSEMMKIFTEYVCHNGFENRVMFSQGNRHFNGRDRCLLVPDKLEDGFVFLRNAE